MAAAPMAHGRRPIMAARFLVARWPGNCSSDAQAARPLSQSRGVLVDLKLPDQLGAVVAVASEPISDAGLLHAPAGDDH
eukprot:8598310-Lingulodinium_polyedra.AAC.1